MPLSLPLTSSCTVNWSDSGFVAPGANVGPPGSAWGVADARALRTAFKSMLAERALGAEPEPVAATCQLSGEG
jgi:hypothetical protein